MYYEKHNTASSRRLASQARLPHMHKTYNGEPMTFKQKPIAAAISLALWSMAAAPAFAQSAAVAPMQTVEVTGIRASLDKSLAVKKAAVANVEVVTAEDIGKMPDKNLADSLQRLTGVAVRTDYDEAEKVSMRGTNPDMSLICLTATPSAAATGTSPTRARAAAPPACR